MNIKTIYYNRYLDDIPQEFLQFTNYDEITTQDIANLDEKVFVSKETINKKNKIKKDNSADNSDFLFIMMTFLLIGSVE